MTGALVREATDQDVDAVVAVGHRTWPVTYGPLAGDDFVEMGLAKWWTASSIAPQVAAGRVLVAEVHDEVVGVAAVGPLDGDLVLFKLYVVPEAQARGVGRALMERVLEDARRTGHRIIRLSYLDGNLSARRFYGSYGFRETHREPTGEGVPDFVWVVKDLYDDEPLEAP